MVPASKLGFGRGARSWGGAPPRRESGPQGEEGPRILCRPAEGGLRQGLRCPREAERRGGLAAVGKEPWTVSSECSARGGAGSRAPSPAGPEVGNGALHLGSERQEPDSAGKNRFSLSSAPHTHTHTDTHAHAGTHMHAHHRHLL